MALPKNTDSEFAQFILSEEKLIGTLGINMAQAYGVGYDDGVEDTTTDFEDEVNRLENERDLLEEENRNLSEKLKVVSSHVGSALSKCK
ncbi:hypothetical protein [Photobacterium profundum]|uniref:hypothetical protein n=1 Tax=Photobacterium profundum TaxID=74109 RepID=UPI0002F85F21|nr:hypothetical protein [Photobacterium profundum]